MRQPLPLVTRFLAPAFFYAGAALALAACASGPQSGAGAPAASGAATTPATLRIDPNGPVRVALLAPNTSSSSAASRAAQDLVAAAEIAQAELAPANLSMKVYDTRGTPAGAAAAAATAIQENAVLILGPLLGPSAEAVGPVAAQAGVNVLAFSNDQRVAGRNVWVLGQLPGDEMRRLFAYAGSQGVGSAAIVHPTNPYGDAVASEASAAGRDAGFGVGPTIGYERSFQGIERTSREAAAAIRSGAVGGVLIADAGDALRSMSAFLAYHDVSPRRYRFMGLSRWADAGNAAERTLRGGWFVAVEPGAKAAFDQRFSARMNRAPSRLASIGYDALAAAAEMLRTDGASAYTSASITRGVGFDGATGRFRLTPDGGNRRSLAVLEVTESGFEVLDPAPRGAPGS